MVRQSVATASVEIIVVIGWLSISVRRQGRHDTVQYARREHCVLIMTL